MLILPIENWSREYVGRLNLALSYKLLFPNEFVCIIPKNSFRIALPFLFRTTVLHKSLQINFKHLISKYRSNRNKYFVMDEEAMHRNISFDSRYEINEEFVDGVISTTEEEYESYVKFGFNDKLHRSINPRIFSLLFPKIYESIESQNEFGKYILFSSNFSLVFPPDGHNIERIINDRNWSVDEINKLNEFVENFKKRSVKVLNYLKEISKTNNLIYRVHPLEDADKVKDYLKDTNIIIQKGGDIIPLLRNSQLILHCGCTSSIEAALLGLESEFLFPMNSEKKELTCRVSYYMDNDVKICGDLLNQPDKIAKEILSLKHSEMSNALTNMAQFLKAPISNKIIESLNLFVILISGTLFNILTRKDKIENVRYDDTLIKQTLKSNIKINNSVRRHLIL